MAALLIAACASRAGALSYPLLALRDGSVEPGERSTVSVGRAASIEAVNRARRAGGLIFVVRQRDRGVEVPAQGDLEPTGTLARIESLRIVQGRTVYVSLEGLRTLRLVRLDGVMAATAETSLGGMGAIRVSPRLRDLSGRTADWVITRRTRMPLPRRAPSQAPHGVVPDDGRGPIVDPDPSAPPEDPRPTDSTSIRLLRDDDPRDPKASRVTDARTRIPGPGEPGYRPPGTPSVLPSEAPSREEGAPLLWWLAGLGGLVAGGIGVVLLVWHVRRHQSNQLDVLRRSMQDSLASDPKAALSAYEEYREAGGDGAAVKPAGLVALFVGAGRQAELASHLSDGFTPRYVIEAAAILGERHDAAQALGLLTDDVMAYAARKEELSDQVVHLYNQSLKLKDLLTRAHGKPAPWRGAFAAALIRRQLPAKALELLDSSAPPGGLEPALRGIRAQALLALGRPEEALGALTSKPRGDWAEGDYVTCLKLQVAVGTWEKAVETYGAVRVRMSLVRAPDLHYEFALCCEERGDWRLASDIYRRFEAEGVAYRDVAERLNRLKESLPALEPAAAGAWGAAGGSRGGAALGAGIAGPAGAGGGGASSPAGGQASWPGSVRTPLPGSAPGLIGGKYQLRRPIGGGGMGVVYEAFDRTLERRVAIKKMRPEIRAQERERDRFLKEARAIARVSHPYIVGIHEIVEADGEIYLVLEYVDGRALSGVLEEKRTLPLAQCRDIFGYVCQAVDCAHKSQVLHRDLKPSNIMLVGGFAKVMDFGLARVAKDTVSRLTQKDTSGTPAYMAPEQHMGEAVAASDVYSMGVTLYEMATGRVPFQGSDLLALKERSRFAPATQVAPGLPASLDAFLAAALQPDPRRRIAAPLEFLERLRNLC